MSLSAQERAARTGWIPPESTNNGEARIWLILDLGFFTKEGSGDELEKKRAYCT
ncbi:hypothetical protein GCM10010912_46070 [Paenibacillus albidus]|uniref:Uncharacterized protein n=1 Tax=Paenibacillus albidus TaxID=2041023 RepID=A0A917FR36_9BACL|nr:hypothetical protein GCM10010912_46070 [Paenibacillus albidus]